MISYIKYIIYYIYRCVSAGKASYKLKYYNIEELKSAVGFTTEYLFMHVRVCAYIYVHVIHIHIFIRVCVCVCVCVCVSRQW